MLIIGAYKKEMLVFLLIKQYFVNNYESCFFIE